MNSTDRPLWVSHFPKAFKAFYMEPDPKDPLLALRGSGKYTWADEHADDYIRRLREGWKMCNQLGASGTSESGVE